MLKNTVMSLPDKFIVFLGRTFSGHNHDYTMLKQEFPPEVDWFKDIHVRVDLGYQGMQSDYHLDQLDIPHKKPRKSKKNPHPELSAVQKAVNKALSQVRIFVEHAIGGMKRYNILVHGFRNRKENFDLYSALLAWGLNCGRMEAFSSPLRWRCFHGYPTA